MLTLNGLDYTEVLNGANAFSYAALSLGGAINFVTHSGRSAPGNSIGVEAGSYGYRKAALSTGGVSADNTTDYYLAYFYNERDGFQRDTPNSGNEYAPSKASTMPAAVNAAAKTAGTSAILKNQASG